MLRGYSCVSQNQAVMVVVNAANLEFPFLGWF